MNFTDNQLKGNWGEQNISERLTRCGCLVRHVPQGHDAGIDLYCESTKNNKLFLHFWVQVKTSNEYLDEKNNISFTIMGKNKIARIQYWLNQPIPVFIFLVPDIRKECNNSHFYICRALDFYNKEGYTIKPSLKIESNDDIETEFLDKELIVQTFLWDLKNGKVSYLKTQNKEYVIEFPKNQSQKFEKKLKESIRWTLRILSDDFFPHDSNETTTSSAKQKSNIDYKVGKVYKDTLECYAKLTKDSHYDTYEIIGRYYELECKYQEAEVNYLKSRRIINQDKKLNPKIKKSLISRIDQRLDRIKEKPPYNNSQLAIKKSVNPTVVTH